MKNYKVLFWLVLPLILSCTKDDEPNFLDNNCLDGRGAIVSESRSFSDFHSIDNSIFADILLIQGSQEDVLIEAQQNILQEVKTKVINGVLKITHGRCLDIDDPVVLHVTIPVIKSLTVTGVGDVISQNDLDVSDLKITLTGVGNFDLEGIAATLDINLTGTGKVKTFGLNTDKCTVRIAGVGDAEVNVNDELDVTITGVGTVSYKGNPTIHSNISGAGRIISAN